MHPASRLVIWWIGVGAIDSRGHCPFYADFAEKQSLSRQERQQPAVKVSVFYFTLVIAGKIVYNEVIILSSLVCKANLILFQKGSNI